MISELPSGRALTIFTLTVAVLLVVGAAGIVIFLVSGTNAPTSSTKTTPLTIHSQTMTTNTDETSDTLCDQHPQPAYLVRLASQVEQTQSFAQQSHGLSYVLASGNNDTGETVKIDDGPPVVYPSETNLAFYSYGNNSTTSSPSSSASSSSLGSEVCPSILGTKGVVGALWIRVPINSDGSYNLANMSIYFTPGVFSNSTSLPPR